MTFSRLTFSAFLWLIILGACSKNSSSTLSPNSVDSLKLVYQNINIQLDTTWAEMMQDDDDKLANLRRILQEVEYSGNYNRLKLDSLRGRVDQLESARYNQQSMSDSESINVYDSLTNQVMGEITIFTTRLEQFEQYPTMGRLLQEVFEADERVLRYRISYDRSVKQYNSFIESHQNDLPLIVKQEDLSPKPLFELQN
jgi:hypothetical protein